MPVSAAASAREILDAPARRDGVAQPGAGEAQRGRRRSSARRCEARSARSICCATACSSCSRRAASKQEAVHVTKLALGEGLVGTIAKDVETLNLDEAASASRFRLQPETGEEQFHSFAGVPIIRRERAVGVLCVQHADPRRYDDVEIEALQTVAMVLSELIANAGLVDDGAAAATDAPAIDRGGAHCRA